MQRRNEWARDTALSATTFVRDNDSASDVLRETTDEACTPPRLVSLPEADPADEVSILAPEQPAIRLHATSLAEAAARECLQALDLLRSPDTAGSAAAERVLVLEPFVNAVGEHLRAGGFRGESIALMSPLLSSFDSCTPDQQPVLEAFDRVHVHDWLTWVHDQQVPPVVAEPPFQAIITLDLVRALAKDDWHATLLWLSRLLVAEGFLIVGEPADRIQQQALERELLSVGFVLAADVRGMDTDWSRRILRWQYRPGDLNRLPGVLSRIQYTDIAADPALKQAVITAYRDIFGGDEWGEWMKCTACGRQFSRREYEALDPRDCCPCGIRDALELFHSPQRVLEEMSYDLADSERSRLYVCISQTQEVEAFIWGYLATAREIADILLPRQGDAERDRLIRLLYDRLAMLGVAEPETALIYHQAYIGSVRQARSFSLPRVLFARMCQFALDSGSRLVVTATIPSVNAYALVRGIGMDVLYRYPPLPPETAQARRSSAGDGVLLNLVRAQEQVAPSGAEREAWAGGSSATAATPTAIAQGAHGVSGDASGASGEHPVMPYSRLDVEGVILAAPIHDVLSLMVRKSDRALVREVGTFLRTSAEAAR